jgi:DNA-binding response OmpR family regulator
MSHKVLVADDEPNILISLEFLMKREGHQVLVARDGNAALDLIRSERPALVLLDVMMPGKSGFEVCAAVRADESLAGVKILMLTAKGRETDTAKGAALGADAYMTKPFATRELAARVRELLLGRSALGVLASGSVTLYVDPLPLPEDQQQLVELVRLFNEARLRGPSGIVRVRIRDPSGDSLAMRI